MITHDPSNGKNYISIRDMHKPPPGYMGPKLVDIFDDVRAKLEKDAKEEVVELYDGLHRNVPNIIPDHMRNLDAFMNRFSSVPQTPEGLMVEFEEGMAARDKMVAGPIAKRGGHIVQAVQDVLNERGLNVQVTFC